MHAAILVLALWSQSVETIARLIETEYVHVDAAAACARHLRARQAELAKIEKPEDLAKALTEELRTACKDKHLEVVVRTPPPPAPPAQASAPAAPASPEPWLEPLRQRNFDFARVERLRGNVGYLQLNSFPPPRVAADTAAAAMAFLAASDAVIIDLRLNSGGDGAMVSFLASYFFDQPTLLSTTYRRASGRTTENWTLPVVPGRRMPSQELFILTSAVTFSAAEGFAYPLQVLKRATIVGEVTKGGANPGRYRNADDMFSVFIPVGATSVPPGNTTWDGTGITPDIAVPALDALPTAHREALTRLASRTADPARRRELEWSALPRTPLPANAAQWAGTYGDIRIIHAGGNLYYQGPGGPQRLMLPIGESAFLIEGLEDRRVRLVATPRSLVVERSSGERESRNLSRP
jgi:retinol-binding protein 3